MPSFMRGFLQLFLVSSLWAMLSDPTRSDEVVPIIVLIVIIWAAWRMTPLGKRAGRVVSARDGAKHVDEYDAHDRAVHGNTVMATDSMADTGATTQFHDDAGPVRLVDKEPTTEDRKSAVLFVDGVPLPDDVHIVPLSQSAPETHKRILGAWVGTCDHSLDPSDRHILIVKDIRADGLARVVWATGDDPLWERDEGIISGDTLSVCLCTYKLTATDRLLATMERFTHISGARMARIEFPELIRPGATIDWSEGVEFIDTDLTEDGKRIRLETVIFKPKGSGPFPLFVFNHGRYIWCTPEALKRSETDLELAEFFLEKGWMVAFPQRRGTGKSDGFHGEELLYNRSGWRGRGEVKVVWDRKKSLSGAERTLADVEAAIAALRRRPDVAGERLLIGGASGGGILSIAYAGLHPRQIAGAINFVGGWDSERSPWARQINSKLFARGAAYERTTLWLYGRGDHVLSIAHSRSNYDAFVRAGGKGEFIEFDVPGENNGHYLSGYPHLWREQVEIYLETLDPADRPLRRDVVDRP